MTDVLGARSKLRRAVCVALAVLAVCGVSACGDDGATDDTTGAADVGVDVADASGGGDDVAHDAASDAQSDAVEDAVADAADVEQVEVPERPWSALERGFYNVGYRRLEVAYTPIGEAQERMLEVAVWYPTRDASGAEVRYVGTSIVQPGVFGDAGVGVDAPMPVLVFSHGSLAWPEASFFMTEFFASHGWLVIAPSHTDDLILNAFDARPDPIYAQRPQDLSAALDALGALPSADPLSGLADMARVGASGHSFGGYTVLGWAGARYDVSELRQRCDGISPTYCAHLDQGGAAPFEQGIADARVRAIVPMSAGNNAMYSGGGVEALDVPALLVSGSRDLSVPDAQHGDLYWQELLASPAVVEHRRLVFPEGAHATLTNACAQFPGVYGANDGCGDDFIDPAEAHAVTNAYGLIFLRHHVLGDTHEGDVLSGARLISEEAVYTTLEAGSGGKR